MENVKNKADRPMPKFENSPDFTIARNEAINIVLPAYSGTPPLRASVGITRIKEDGTLSNLFEALWTSPVEGKETIFKLTKEQMTLITSSDIFFIKLEERYSLNSGTPEFGIGDQSPEYQIKDIKG
jgi:hypothetical protein